MSKETKERVGRKERWRGTFVKGDEGEGEGGERERWRGRRE